ncbi:MAG: SEC-C metal-binding domain-containing protein, partial [Pseudomonadota bacterium]|nr:SEC-C metal-binding domain-containing protein [Pseudomonadota bacterium]
YKREAFEMFGEMLEQVKHDTISILSRVRIQSEQDVQRMEEERRKARALKFKHDEASALSTVTMRGTGAPPPGGGQPVPDQQTRQEQPGGETFVRSGRKIGRNEPCPCGSGKKYKQCHGKLE